MAKQKANEANTTDVTTTDNGQNGEDKYAHLRVGNPPLDTPTKSSAIEQLRGHFKESGYTSLTVFRNEPNYKSDNVYYKFFTLEKGRLVDVTLLVGGILSFKVYRKGLMTHNNPMMLEMLVKMVSMEALGALDKVEHSFIDL